MAIKLLIWDLDGCLVNTSEIHFSALNQALSDVDPKFSITKEYDIQYLGTIPTREKLKILTKIKGLPEDKHQEILEKKKQYTIQQLDSLNTKDYFSIKTKKCIEKLSKDFKLHLVSNTNLEFATKILDKTGLTKFFSSVITNDFKARTKPAPDFYWHSMMQAEVLPEETIIFEDSTTGQAAAIRSGSNLYPLESPADVNYEDIIDHINNLTIKPIKWQSKKIQVLIPCSGEGSRFRDVGYKIPKPIIDVNGLPMVGLVAQKLNIDAHFIFVVKGEHCQEYNFEALLKVMHPDCTIVKTWGKQGGAACSVLEAKQYINNDKHLLIVNSDQIWEWNANEFYYQMIREDLDGGIVVFEDPSKNPKWSFAKINNEGFVEEVAEKKPISIYATSGQYFYKKGSDFVKYAEQMIAKNIRVNNEFYVAPVYNEFILDKKKIKTFPCKRMIGLGTPEDLEKYLKETFEQERVSKVFINSKEGKKSLTNLKKKRNEI